MSKQINQNGQLVLQTLQALEEPSTANKISKEIANLFGADVGDVKSPVKETLNAGVEYGFIQRLNQKYFSVPVDVNAESKEQKTDNEIFKEYQDRVSRRRKTARSRRRVGSRSKGRVGRRRRRGSKKRQDS